MTAHNRASEFVALVRKSGPIGHVELLAGRYSTPFATALAALDLRQFNKTEPFKSWRRGQAAPRPWAALVLANRLEEIGHWYIAQGAAIRQARARQTAAQAGAAHWRRYWAQKAAEKEKPICDPPK